MLKKFFLEEVENVLKNNKIGQMESYEEGTLHVEKPKNLSFGDFAINVSPLARFAKIAPPLIAQQIAEHLSKNGYEINIVAGFINFKVGESMLENIIEEVFNKNIRDIVITGMDTASQIALSVSWLTSSASSFEPVGNTAPTPR